MEILRKSNQTEIMEIKGPFSQAKNSMEGHCSRLEQMKENLKAQK
jgi:hypothetical protein